MPTDNKTVQSVLFQQMMDLDFRHRNEPIYHASDPKRDMPTDNTVQRVLFFFPYFLDAYCRTQRVIAERKRAITERKRAMTESKGLLRSGLLQREKGYCRTQGV